jgi:hypothetical protein
MKTLLFCALLLIATAAAVPAQWAKQQDPGVPSLRDGKPNLSARSRRAADGKPDLSGVWENVRDPLPKGVLAVEGDDFSVPRYFRDVTADMKPEQVQMEPWAEALFTQRSQSRGLLDPISRCKPVGIPALDASYPPYKIIQTPRLLLILYEYHGTYRQIFLDGRKSIPDPNPTWMGYSTGRWDGDSLVVETVGFHDLGWLDRMGHPHSDALHVVERFRRRDVGHLEIEVTVDDPKTYRRPIVWKQQATLMPEEDLLEYFCEENEKDVQHFQP